MDISSDTDEALELAVGSIKPETSDKNREDNGAHRVDPPAEFTTADRSQDTEAVDKEVIPVILPEDTNLGDVAQSEAIEEEGELGAEGDNDSDDGG